MVPRQLKLLKIVTFYFWFEFCYLYGDILELRTYMHILGPSWLRLISQSIDLIGVTDDDFIWKLRLVL